MNINDKIVELLANNLGNPVIKYNQIKFNCPKCDSGNKYNLEINTRNYVFNCWACHYHGYITKLLKEYSSNNSWKLLTNELSNNTSKKFINSHNNAYYDEYSSKNSVIVPDKTIPFYLNDSVKRYLLEERHVNNEWLISRKCLYVNDDESDLKHNIVFPFYDFNHNLRGYCCHNYITKKYKNFGVRNYVPYETFINYNLPITITEGIYDASSVPNAIPLLNTDINEEILLFCKDKNVILSLDRDVKRELIESHVHKLREYGASNIYVFNNLYKDLNEYKLKDPNGLRNKYYRLMKSFN